MKTKYEQEEKREEKCERIGTKESAIRSRNKKEDEDEVSSTRKRKNKASKRSLKKVQQWRKTVTGS
jgi:hypothetical protein